MNELPPIDFNQLRRDRLARQKADPLPGYSFIYGEPPQGSDDPPNVFTIPHEADWSSSAAMLLAAGDLPRAFRELLGEDQWSQLLRHDPEPTVGDWVEFEAALAAQQGLRSLGESPESANGSPITPEPSEATSNGSTDSTSPRSSTPARRIRGQGPSKT